MRREDIEAAIRTRAAEDPAFRADLVADPPDALERAFGVAVPDAIAIRVVEERVDEVVLVLPAPTGSRPVSDDELSAVIGGYDSDTHTTCKY